MRIHEVRVHAFKGLDVEFPWTSAIVLFGPNDSGKSNVLEGFLSRLGGKRPARLEPFVSGRMTSDEAEVSLLVELDGLDIVGHPDQQLFVTWILDEHVEAVWKPQLAPPEEEKVFDEEELWAGAKELHSLLDRIVDRDQAIASLVDQIRSVARQTRDRRLALAGQNETLECESGSTAMESRWFVVRGGGMLDWVPGPGWVDDGQELAEFALLSGGMQSFHDPLGLRVISVEGSESAFDDLGNRLEKLLEQLTLTSQRRSYGDVEYLAVLDDPWIERDADTTRLRQSMLEASAHVAALVNELTPRFVSDVYRVVIAPLHPDEWRAHGSRRVTVRLRPHALDGEDFDLAVASSGMAVWTQFALSEAIRLEEERLQAGDAAGADPVRMDRTIYVLDEPGAHLHPLAQEQAAAWVADRVRAGAHVLLATHALPFLRLPLADVEYLKVTRSPSWETRLEPITTDVLGAVAEASSTLGLPPVAVIQLTRAWLIVEGEHDKKIIEAFYGRDLRQSGVQTLPLRGAARAKASFLNLAALGPLGMPFFCLLDNARAETAVSDLEDKVHMSEEERIAEQLCRLRDEKGVEVTVLRWPYPDIVCALPIEVVRQVAQENGGKPQAASTWRDLVDRHREQREARTGHDRGRHDFKRYLLDTLGLEGWSADRLVDEALSVCEGQPPEGSPLSPLISQVLASVDMRTSLNEMPPPSGSGSSR